MMNVNRFLLDFFKIHFPEICTNSTLLLQQYKIQFIQEIQKRQLIKCDRRKDNIHKKSSEKF